MARPYSDDLREKLLEAYDQGRGSLTQLAVQFGVSPGWAWKISAARKRTGSTQRPSYVPGPKQRVDQKAVASLLRADPDLTLAELQEQLQDKTGLRVSIQHLWRIVKRLGFRLKKVTPRPRARYGAKPQTPPRVRRSPPYHPDREADFPGRKRRIDANDATLCSSRRRAPHSRSDPSGQLEDSDDLGRYEY